MTLIEYPDIEQRSPEWFEQRRGIVTASVVGSLVTPTLKVAGNDVSRGLTALLVAERITGVAEDNDYVSADMMRGILDEPVAIEKYAEHRHASVTTTGFMVRREDDWTLGYSPDGLVEDDGLVEVKCPRAKTHLRTILADEIPARHMAQIQAGLLVTGRKWLDFISFHGGMPLFVKRAHPDPKWHEAIVAACQKFETTAAEMVAAYESKTADMPATERTDSNLGLVF